jgi:glutamine cyclotransferase
VSACAGPGQPIPGRRAPTERHRVVRAFPHDPQAFTQGLVWVDNALYESTGLNGQSSIRRVDFETGTVLAIRHLPAEDFGEGITSFGSTIIQLTWRSGVARVYDRQSLDLLDVRAYAGEGWGLTDDGMHLIASDGSSTLKWLDPASFREVKRVFVKDGSTAVRNLNDLQYVNGDVFANVWGEGRIARICPATGLVQGWLDLSELVSRAAGDRSEVLNGIAYVSERGHLLVTGKHWWQLFEIELLPGTAEATGALPSINAT